MIIGPVTIRERDDWLERAATITWADGEFEVYFSAPPAITDTTADASGLLAVCLPLAMRLGEDLRVEGPVSPMLLERCADLQALYATWAPFTRRISIAADAEAMPIPSGARAVIGFFSRGVDSVFTVARSAASSRPFDACVFTDGLEPMHDANTRSWEIVRATEAADRIGMPMLRTETNVRWLTNPIVKNWEDMCGAGLAHVAHGMANGVQASWIASTDSYESFEPAGTSPMLDPLFSTERMQIHHDSIAFTRLDKIRWLVEHCPQAIDDLKVCYEENRPDNCGRCGKCMITMACLHVVGALDRATQFPDQLDLEAIAAMYLPVPKALIDWSELGRLDDDNCGGALRAAVRAALHNSVKRAHEFQTDRGPLWMEPRSFRTHRLNLLLGLLLDGEPYPDRAPPAADPVPEKRRFRRR